MDNIGNKALKEVLEKDNSSELTWILLLLFLGNNAGVSELAKVKEELAELKGKMSIIEKMF